MRAQFTISVTSTSLSQSLNRIFGAFSRRRINIQGIHTTFNELEEMYNTDILIVEDASVVNKLAAHLRKQIDVLDVSHEWQEGANNEEIVQYKVPKRNFDKGSKAEKLVKQYQAKVLSVDNETAIIEKSGVRSENEAFLSALGPLGVFEFTKMRHNIG